MIKTFPLRMTIEEHKEIQTAARKQGKCLHQFIMDAVKIQVAVTK